ncbi:MAG: excisionase family DNA-binding protein [Caldilineaceae bacterium]
MSKNPETSKESENEQPSQRIQPDDEWMTIQDATAYTKIKRGTLYQLMKDNILPWYRVTGTSQRRLKRSDLDKLMVPGHLDGPDKGELTDENENA